MLTKWILPITPLPHGTFGHPYLSDRSFNPLLFLHYSLAFFVSKLQYPVCHPLASRYPLDLANLVLVTYLVAMTTCLIKVTQGEKAFTLAHSLRLPSIPMRKAGQRKHEQLLMLSGLGKINTDTQFAFFQLAVMLVPMG